jgi:alpha-tubulin suppressor-like RCC1 family protein
LETSSLRTADRGPSLRGYCWGNNNAGGLGIGSVARAMVPVAVALPEGTVDVQGGSDFTVALTSGGQVWAWGGNGSGQLGDGSDRLRLTPHPVPLPSGVRVASISVGAGHVLVLSQSGSVFGWGRNTHGQLGDGTTTDRREPVEVSVGQVTQLATGIASSHAVTSTGSLLSWGRAIGPGTSTGPGAVGVTAQASLTLPRGAEVAMVDAGQRHLVVLTRAGQLLTFGVDPGGRPLPASMPAEPSFGRVTSISAGDNHTVALTGKGVVLAWGANYYGQLGTRDRANRATPVGVRIPKLRGHIVEVVAGGDFVVARSSHHEIFTWGQGRFGQNGNGQATDQTGPRPVSIPQGPRVTGVYTGRYHQLVLTDQHS